MELVAAAADAVDDAADTAVAVNNDVEEEEAEADMAAAAPTNEKSFIVDVVVILVLVVVVVVAMVVMVWVNYFYATFAKLCHLPSAMMLLFVVKDAAKDERCCIGDAADAHKMGCAL